jgi:ribosomal protein S18 acetylase RimI-like enzyme
MIAPLKLRLNLANRIAPAWGLSARDMLYATINNVATEKSPAFTIRRATVEDAQQILDCLRDAFEPYRTSYAPEGFRDTVLTADTVLSRLDEMTILVATDEAGKVIGTVAGKLSSGSEGHLRGMAVLPEFQGRGVAEQLLAAIESHLSSQGYERITLDTTEPLKRATRFYERNGYKLSGRVTDFFGMRLYEYVRLSPDCLTAT